MTADLDLLPDLVCGQTYLDPRSEERLAARREGEVTPYTGCGERLVWLVAYRCRPCGRWMHGTCLDRHFENGETP